MTVTKPTTPVWHGSSNYKLYLPCHEGSGVTANDYAGGDLDGTLTPTASWQTQAEGAVIRCGVSGRYVTLGDPAALRFSGAFSLVWYGYLTSSGALSSALIGKFGPANQRACGMQLYSEAVYLSWSTDGVNLYQQPGAITRSNPSPDLIVGTFEPSVALRLYQNNGTLLLNKTDGVPAAFFNANGLPWNVMTRGDANTMTPGDVSMVAMLDKALSLAEVQAIYADPWAVVRGNRRRGLLCGG